MARAKRKERALDTFLVASARIGDRRSFGLLVERWDPKLRAHAWRLLGDREQARDVVQDSWADIVRGLKRLKEDAAFPVWALRIVSRRCARAIAHLQRQRQLDAAVEAESEAGEIPYGDGDALRAAIRALPAGQRAAIALYHFEDLSIAETAVALDVSAGTVKTRLMHARRKLRDALTGDEECGTSIS